MDGMNRVVFAVNNDLSADQRMDRTAAALEGAGIHVHLIGVGRPAAESRPGTRSWVRPCWRKPWNGKLFYLAVNLRLFLRLLRVPADLLVAVDLDTLVAVRMAGWLRGLPTGLDAHEYFPGIAEVVTRPRTRALWRWVQNRFVPGVVVATTVSDGLARLLHQDTGVSFTVVRTMPDAPTRPVPPYEPVRRLVFQGRLNAGRGLEELVDAMEFVDATLTLAGDGDLERALRTRVARSELGEKVRFTGFVPPSDILDVLAGHGLAVNLYTGDALNNRHSLNNKFFLYVQAGLPILNIDYPEYRALAADHPVCHWVDDVSPRALAARIEAVLHDADGLVAMHRAAVRARSVWIWDREADQLVTAYHRVFDQGSA